MINSNPSIALILQGASVPNMNNVFVLGCYAKRVTFYSQQNRALNLVWALFEAGKISKTSRIGIVGAGLAGITAAVAAKSKGCVVEIYDSNDQIMHIQRGNWTRYIHPNIYDWPRVGSEKNFTELPFLNWKADVTDHVIRQIEAEWDEYSSQIPFHGNHKVTGISEDNNVPRISIIEPFKDEPYDCVIVAVGFGVEKQADYILPRSYWSSDSLHQAITAAKTPQDILVSGCGDGGLIDTLRLTLKDFRHDVFSSDLLSDTTLDELRLELLAIEEKIPSVTTDHSRFIFDEYKKLVIPDTILNKLKRRIRSDTKVRLIGTKSTPFSPNTSVLNRFAVFLLVKLGKISYETVKFVGAELNRNYFALTLEGTNNTIKKSDYDQVVLRHGPTPVVNTLVAPPALSVATLDNETAHKLWTDGFYPIKSEPEPTAYEIAEKHRLSLFEKIKKSKSLSDIGVSIGGSQEQPKYLVTYNGELKKTMKSLQEWFGIPILFHKAQLFSTSSISFENSNSLKMSFSTRTLTVGSAIRNKNSKSGFGTLGCFVSLPNETIGILSTNHVLWGRITDVKNPNPISDSHTRIFSINIKDQTEYEIGKINKVLPMVYTNRTKHNIFSGMMDAAVARLKSGISFSPMFRFYEKQISVTEVTDPIPGLTVYKIGAGSGFTKGIIYSVSGTHKVASGISKDNIIVNDVFLVQGENKMFSESGDSGAVVFDEAGRAYGIIIANSHDFSLVLPLKSVLNALECRLFSLPIASKS